jgi:diaminopimelate epimerase
MREYKVVVADPAKNITVFVLNEVENRAEAAKAIMADPSLGAEQVGFVIPPTECPVECGEIPEIGAGGSSQKQRGLWRLEMMGGEFCGNAARAFGLFVARTLGLTGDHTLSIEISGARAPLSVRVSTAAANAEVDMPKPLAEHRIAYGHAALPVIAFEGITHIIAPDTPPSRETFFAFKKIIEEKSPLPGALGVMFWDITKNFMTPAVYVYATGSLVFESSCGSGCAALALWQSRGLHDGEFSAGISQPGGIITAHVNRHGGELVSVSIGGEVSLGKERVVYL